MPQRTVFFDVDTQFDFMLPAGSLYVPGAEKLLPNLAALSQFAATNRHPLISTVDAHLENDVEFRSWPAHCIAGTLGQQKVSLTRLNFPAAISSTPGMQIVNSPQYIVEKQVIDAFSNPNLLPLLDRLQGDCYIVYGVVTEICVERALAGLLKLGNRIVLVTDAIQSLTQAGDRVVNQYQQSGVDLRTTAQVVSGAY